MPRICKAVLGKKHGNFHPAKPREEFLRTMDQAQAYVLPSQVRRIFAPATAFTTRIAEIGSSDDDTWSERLIRTKEKADGALLHGTDTAVAIFNGDCPIICLKQEDFAVILHAGYRCLIRSDANEEGIIEAAMRHFDPLRAEALVFGGIGPCCWIPEPDKTEIWNPQLSRHPTILESCLSETKYGGNRTVDLYKLANDLLCHAGIYQTRITLEAQCTCCAKEGDAFKFWSHTRHENEGQTGEDGRNCSLIWLAP